MSYNLVPPEKFTNEQKQFLSNFKEAVITLSAQTNIILGCKDIDSRNIIATDATAYLLNLPRGVDVEGRFDRDIPCEGFAQFADCFVAEDKSLLDSGDINKKMSLLEVMDYAVGMKAFACDKHILKHHASQSILGIIYAASEIKIGNFFAIIPNYFNEFGVGCSIQDVGGSLSIDGVTLTEYEHEICFLLILNWNYNQIASFMNKHRPSVDTRVADTIYKCRNRVCEKLGIPDYTTSQFKEKLVEMGIHRKMPQSFFQRLVGSTPLH